MIKQLRQYSSRFYTNYCSSEEQRQTWSFLLMTLIYLHLLFLPEIITLPLCIHYRTIPHLYMQNLTLLLLMSGLLLIFGRIGTRFLLILYGLWGVFNVITVFSLVKFHILVDATMLQILAVTESHEVGEFCQTYLHWYDFWPFVVILVCTILLWRRTAKITKFGRRLGMMLCIPFCLAALPHLCTGHLSWFGKRNSLCRFIATGFTQYNREMKQIHSAMLSPELPKDIHLIPSELPDAGNGALDYAPLGIVVVGESARRHNFQCYGYLRETTPRLMSYHKKCFFFDNVISPATSTLRCCIYDFSMSTIGCFDSPQFSICDLLKSAGYSVALYSNQRRSGNHESLGMLFHNADIKTYLMEEGNSDRHDMALLDYIRQSPLLERKSKPAILFLHTMGSHHHAKKRYPDEFAIFPTELRDKSNEGFDTASAEYVNCYDNSIRYTDELLGRIMDFLEEQERPSFMLYLSDHAENLAKTKSDTDFRNALNPAVYEIPFVVYANNAYRKQWPSFIAEWADNISKPMQADATIFAIASLARVTYAGFQDNRNILSSRYVPVPRYMKEQKKIPYPED